MRGPIGSSRTSDTEGFVQTFGNNLSRFTPLSTSTPKQKYKYPYCPLEYNLKSSRDRHVEAVHGGKFDPTAHRHPNWLLTHL